MTVAALIIGPIGLLYGFWAHFQAWRWAKYARHSRIAIARKGRVKLQAPLSEWILWCRQLDADKDSRGRVVWSMAGTSVAITRAITPPNRLAQWRNRRKGMEDAPNRMGNWAATDQT